MHLRSVPLELNVSKQFNGVYIVSRTNETSVLGLEEGGMLGEFSMPNTPRRLANVPEQPIGSGRSPPSSAGSSGSEAQQRPLRYFRSSAKTPSTSMIVQVGSIKL